MSNLENKKLDAGNVGDGETKAEKLSDKSVESVSGGFVGDWTGDADMYYEWTGIYHKKDLLSKDKYFLDGKEISYEDAQEIINIAKTVHKENPYKSKDAIGERAVDLYRRTHSCWW